MPPTDFQGSSASFAALGRSILTIRREQVHAMDGELELEAFQRQIADLFVDLAACVGGDGAAGGVSDEILSIAWVRKLLDTFIVCLEEFRVILFNRRAQIGRPPLDRLLADFFEREVKALDVCNAVRDGVDQVKQWRRHIEIVLLALCGVGGEGSSGGNRGAGEGSSGGNRVAGEGSSGGNRTVGEDSSGGDRAAGEGSSGGKRAAGEGQLRRAKKALADLTILMLDEKDASAGSVFSSHRNRSFGRNTGSSASGGGRDHQRTHFRSLSWSVSRSWSAARQLQAIGNNISAPRGHEVTSTSGLAVPVYTMSTILLFVMWVLVAAIPCQDRGLQVHFSVPRSFPWSAPIVSLHDRILEESKKKDRKHSSGLLKEIHQTERCMHLLTELTDALQCPISEDKAAELRQVLEELTQVCDSMKEGLDPLERQVREVFLRLVRSRTEGFDSLSHIAE